MKVNIMENEKKRERKEGIKKGQRTQKMVSFRADMDVIEILSKVCNKGLLLNTLVKQWWRQQPCQTLDDPDVNPDENDGHDTES